MSKTESTKTKSGLHFISAFIPSTRLPFRGDSIFIPTDNAGAPAFGFARPSMGFLQPSVSRVWERGQTAFTYLFLRLGSGAAGACPSMPILPALRQAEFVYSKAGIPPRR
ncbi:MAG: hypothetical protein ABSD44_15715 [Terracidiphilus sp.]